MTMKSFTTPTLLATLLMTSCAQNTSTPQEKFMQSLNALCGKSFAGKLVSTDEVDTKTASLPMVMEVRECSDTQMRIPFHIGDNHSRTWIITKTDQGLRLEHQHNHENGHADAVTLYGGDTTDIGTATHQNFPVNQFSKDMFVKEGLNVSVTNIWSIEISPTKYAYEMRREGRQFRAEFDLTQTVATPPKPW
ncbi:MAG: hypothetical protein COA43_08810 [Robiginitomaculum sp.]|nr:MAG: hypothetical protein COA43_08810 [Robiginitomaculum sp.]